MCNSYRIVFHIKSSTKGTVLLLIRSNFSLLLLWKPKGDYEERCVCECVFLDEVQSFHLFSLQSMSDRFLN